MIQFTTSGRKACRTGLGLNNIGLLVKLSGKVTASGTNWFKITDRTAIDDSEGNATIMEVYVDAQGQPVTAINSTVSVTGISSCYSPQTGSASCKSLLATTVNVIVP